MRTDGGYGLGLSLASTIARAHGATLDVQSAEGAGSVFSATFPLRFSDRFAAGDEPSKSQVTDDFEQASVQVAKQTLF